MKKNIIEQVVKDTLEEAGISDEKMLTKRIMDKLTDAEKKEAEKNIDAGDEYLKRVGNFRK